MTQSIRMSVWGWFLRAFAAGFGVMFGVFTASIVICCGSYMLFAAFAIAFANIGTNNTQQLVPTMAAWQQPTSNIAPQLYPPPASSPTSGTPTYCVPPTPYAAGNQYANLPTAATTAYQAPAVEEPVALPVPCETEEDVQYFASGPNFQASDEPDDDAVEVDKPIAADSVPVFQETK